jgi:hypothetical protein
VRTKEGAAQRADEDETALVAPRGPRVEKKAGSRTTGRQRIFLDRSVESFTAVRIGEVRELSALSPADRMRCRVEWQQRKRYIILQRWMRLSDVIQHETMVDLSDKERDLCLVREGPLVGISY